MARSVAALLLTVFVSAGCGRSSPPTGPTSVQPSAAPVPAAPASPVPPSAPETLGAAITSFAMTGQVIEGTYHYWPALTIRAGSEAVTLQSFIFRIPGATLTRDRVSMSWPMAAGSTYTRAIPESGLELLGTGPATQAIVTVTYAGADGRSQELTATTDVAPIDATPSDAALRITSFDVVRWSEGRTWNYWPRLTVMEVSNRSALTITRVEFRLPDIGINGQVPPAFGSWQVPAGGTRDLFRETYLDEPNTAVSSSYLTDRFRITLSYVDAAGRPGDVTAEAMAHAR